MARASHGFLCLIASVSLVSAAFAQPQQCDTGFQTVHSVLAQHQAKAPADKPAKSIPFDQLATEAQKQYSGEGIAITADGATLRAAFQKLEGHATREGLWLTSTAEATGKPTRFLRLLQK